MLVIGDFKQLEFNACAYLAQDKVAIEELNSDGYDIHENNRVTLGLPTRLISKVFLFRLIYGGTSAAYVADPDFREVSKKKEFWDEVINKFYQKYGGIYKWHEGLVLEAMNTGRVTIPTGRFFKFKPYQYNHTWVWPRTKILNYPVQGLGADLMVLARVLLRRSTIEIPDMKLIGTVHDSIIVDVPSKEIDNVEEHMYHVWDRIPRMFEKVYGVPYNILCKVEVKHGPNMACKEETQ